MPKICDFKIYAYVKFHGHTKIQTDFYKVGTYLDRLLMPEINVITNFVKSIRIFLEKVNRGLFKRVGFTNRQDREADFLKG